MTAPRTEKVYTLVRRDGDDGVYARVGTATWGDDGRIHIELDALPVSGRLVIGVPVKSEHAEGES